MDDPDATVYHPDGIGRALQRTYPAAHTHMDINFRLLFLSFLGSFAETRLVALTGHISTHFPHPVHLASSMTGDKIGSDSTVRKAKLVRPCQIVATAFTAVTYYHRISFRVLGTEDKTKFFRTGKIIQHFRLRNFPAQVMSDQIIRTYANSTAVIQGSITFFLSIMKFFIPAGTKPDGELVHFRSAMRLFHNP